MADFRKFSLVRLMLVTFGDFLENVLKNRESHVMPTSIRKAITSVLDVSSAEAKRGFSEMNPLYSDKRSSLLVENINNFMTIICLVRHRKGGIAHHVQGHGFTKIILLVAVAFNEKG